MGKAARNKALKDDKKKEVVMGNEKMQLKTADKCAKLAPRRSFAKKAKEVKLNLKKIESNVKKHKTEMKKIANKLKL